MLLTCLQWFPGPVRFNQTAVTVWGLGLATGCVLFGAILLWGRMEIAHGSYAMKGPSREVEPSPDAVKRERIAALLLQKSKRQQEDEKWTSGLRNLWLWWILISCSARELRYLHNLVDIISKENFGKSSNSYFQPYLIFFCRSNAWWMRVL